MAALDINAIRDYLIEVGCKIEYPILVHAFKKHLYNPKPAEQAKMRTQFKDYVNRLATVTLENNMKFIVLRPEFIPQNDQKLAHSKDIVNGYTALHWAAKFGNLDIIKLIAGTHGVSVNIKSSAGYTPLHIAAMFNRTEVADLLIRNYGADPNIRDHSGRRAKQYWPVQEDLLRKRLPPTPFK